MSSDAVIQLAGLFLQITGVIVSVTIFINKIKIRLDRIEAEYKPNHGSSLRDAINRIETKIAKLEGRFEQHVEEAD